MFCAFSGVCSGERLFARIDEISALAGMLV